MDKYSEVNVDISKATVKKLLGQLWYLSVELIPLCLFDRNVSIETKRKISQTLKEQDDDDDEAPKRAVVHQKDIMRQKLEDFASPRSRSFFDVLHLNSDFLHKDPDQWETEDSFVQSRTIVSKLKVVNDCAERGVALATEYNSLITYDEEQKQYLLQAVTDHRKRFLDCKKSTLNK